MPTHPHSYSPGPSPDDPSATTLARAASGLPEPRLWRSRSNRVFAGVLGGLAEKFGLEPLVVRLVYGTLTVLSAGFLALPYVAVWAITRPHGPERTRPRFWRSTSKRIVGGVLGGFAERTGASPIALRVLYAAVTAFTMFLPGTLLYLLLWVVTPAFHDRRGPHDDFER
jgi:phage shock protein PspC (stress-responsive transcriptional regulator)